MKLVNLIPKFQIILSKHLSKTRIHEYAPHTIKVDVDYWCDI